MMMRRFFDYVMELQLYSYSEEFESILIGVYLSHLDTGAQQRI